MNCSILLLFLALLHVAACNYYYRISRVSENEYLMVKNILKSLIEHHANVTFDYLTPYTAVAYSSTCDYYFEYMAVNQVISKDFRHPNHLFKKLTNVNETIRTQYESEWYYKYKLIATQLNAEHYRAQCNNLGLKLYYLVFDFVQEQSKIFKCSSSGNPDDVVTALVDYYIAQTFLKDCAGNLEMLAKGIYKLLKYDCERAFTMKLAYFNSRYLNLFRACSSESTVNDLLNSGRFNNCTQLPVLNGHLNRKYCSWFDIVCKYPTTCLKSMNWTNE